MPVKRKRYVKNMNTLWKTYDKSMTSLMVLIYGQLHMAFMYVRLRMDDIHGRLRMAIYAWLL